MTTKEQVIEIVGNSPSGKLIAKYIELRDKKKADETALKEQHQPLVEVMSAIENELHKRMMQDDTDTIRHKGVGTAYLAEEVSAKVEDREGFRNWIIEGQVWDAADLRPNKTFVKQYLDSHGESPPGIAVKRRNHVNIRIS